MKKKWMAWLLTVLLLVGLTGCGGDDKDEITDTDQTQEEIQTPEVSDTPDPEPEPEPEPYVPSGINPLTGLPMEEEYENDRPVAVMFNNLKAAQPQLGVSQADIIYEVPAEGGITRMLGIFQSMDGVGNLGSIRSTRTYFLELALGHDALLLHAGGSPDAYDKISAWGVASIDGVKGGNGLEELFWRDAQRKQTAGYEHSLLTSGENLQEYLANSSFRLEHRDGYEYPLTFAEDGTPAEGEYASHITLEYSYYKTGLFDYDHETCLYMVSQYGGEYVDGNSGEQVGVTNLLVLETDVAEISGDAEGRQEVDLTGSGKGTYFCGGRYIPIRWNKADRSSPFTYTDDTGVPITLGAGTTYVCIMDPADNTLTISE